MSEGWIESTLGEISDISSGSRAKGGAVESGVPSIGGEQIGENRAIRFEKMKFVPQDHFDKMKQGKLEAGDSLLVKDGATTGKVGYWNFEIPAAVNEHVFILRAKKTLVEPFFLNLLISLPLFRKEIESRTRGIIGGINRDIEDIRFNIPPLPEQKRIVDLISSVDLYVNALQTMIESARKARLALLDNMFISGGSDWRDFTLGEVCDFVNGDRGKNYPSANLRQSHGIPFINAGHLEDGSLSFDEMDFISEEVFEKLGSGKIKEFDILFCLRGSVGKFGSVGRLDRGAIASSLVIIRTRENVTQPFLLNYLDSEMCRTEIAQSLTGAVQPNLSAASLKSFKISVPSLEKQQELTGVLDSFQSVIKRSTELLNSAKILRSGMLIDIITGEYEIPSNFDKVLGES